MIAAPAHRASQGASRKTLPPSLMIEPQVGVGGRTPIPRQLRFDSIRMAEETYMVATTKSEGMMFGRTCLRQVRRSDLLRTALDFEKTLVTLGDVSGIMGSEDGAAATEICDQSQRLM